jgi:hypothetical protein
MIKLIHANRKYVELFPATIQQHDGWDRWARIKK